MARITVDLSRGLFDVEGEEEFVQKQFEEFLPKLEVVRSMSPRQASIVGGKDVNTPAKPQKSKALNKPRSVTKSAKVQRPDSLKLIDIIPDSIEGLPPYRKLKKDQDRFLWVLAVSLEINIKDGLERQEIAWLSDELGHGLDPNLLTSKYNSARDRGFANKSTQTHKIRITEDGLDYLKSLTLKKSVE